MKIPRVVKVSFCIDTGCSKQRNCYKQLGERPYPCVVRKSKFIAYRVLGKILLKENHHEDT